MAERKTDTEEEGRKKKKKRGDPPLYLPAEIQALEARREIEERRPVVNMTVVKTIERQLAEARRGRP